MYLVSEILCSALEAIRWLLTVPALLREERLPGTIQRKAHNNNKEFVVYYTYSPTQLYFTSVTIGKQQTLFIGYFLFSYKANVIIT